MLGARVLPIFRRICTKLVYCACFGIIGSMAKIILRDLALEYTRNRADMQCVGNAALWCMAAIGVLHMAGY